MAIKVVFPTGASSATVAGLYQWDYGQALEIECPEIGSEIVEVHFACTGMNEAIVRPCTFSNGAGSVIIPDRCLEQTSAITAWIYKVDSTQGHTIKTITLPIVARTRPGKLHDVPSTYVDKYAELISEVNEVIDNIEKGNITVSNALSANTAKSADTAINAQSASYATSAGSATTASSATRATTADSATTATRATNADSAKNATYATSAGSATSASSATKATMVDTSLVCSITITNGKGEAPTTFVDDTIYFAKFEEPNLSHSGVFWWSTSTDGNFGALGEYVLAFVTGGGGRDINILKNGAVYGNGTLKFYKLGEV